MHWFFENLQAAQDRQAGVLKRGKLAGEEAELLGGDLADRERLLLFLAARLLGGGLAALLLGRALGDLGDEEPLLPDQLLGFFLGRGIDGVLDFLARRVHRFVLKGRHACGSRQSDGGFVQGEAADRSWWS